MTAAALPRPDAPAVLDGWDALRATLATILRLAGPLGALWLKPIVPRPIYEALLVRIRAGEALARRLLHRRAAEILAVSAPGAPSPSRRAPPPRRERPGPRILALEPLPFGAPIAPPRADARDLLPGPRVYSLDAPPPQVAAPERPPCAARFAFFEAPLRPRACAASGAPPLALVLDPQGRAEERWPSALFRAPSGAERTPPPSALPHIPPGATYEEAMAILFPNGVFVAQRPAPPRAPDMSARALALRAETLIRIEEDRERFARRLAAILRKRAPLRAPLRPTCALNARLPAHAAFANAALDALRAWEETLGDAPRPRCEDDRSPGADGRPPTFET